MNERIIGCRSFVETGLEINYIATFKIRIIYILTDKKLGSGGYQVLEIWVVVSGEDCFTTKLLFHYGFYLKNKSL